MSSDDQGFRDYFLEVESRFCQLRGRPLLLFHGERDEILPPQASEMVRMIAGYGDLEILPGDGHLLGRSDDAMLERLDEWLPPVLFPTG